MKKQFGSNKIILLLGAGASCDANIKNSVQMISEIKGKLESEWNEFKSLFNYIESSHFHLERIKNIRLNEINFNIENLVGLLDTIIRISKKEVEGYNFVGSWEKELNSVAGLNFEKAQAFKNEILKKLKEKWLSPSDFKSSSSYYKRLAATGYTFPLKIFSLNYDMCVEHNMEADGRRLERGFDEDRIWDYRRYDLDKDGAAEFYLYKLHGSLDWYRDDESRLTFVDGVQTIDPLKMEIIFGVQNKLQSYDPFNYYFYAFREACFESELIVVSGYGFLDKHINDNISNAFKINPNRKLLVNCYNPDPSFDDAKYQTELARRLSISDKNSIHVLNKKAIDFFNNDLNIDFFASLFPGTTEEISVLPE
ncbi:SIR2 family protein [Anaerocolumna jejuensis]|uniref:SIR2 family protein n=1 Tax=Anaerocolumna jejuensis TaxID=259063 RepID=UPI003F7B79DC